MTAGPSRTRECHEALFEEALVRRILHAFHQVARALGAGFAPAVYVEAMRVELESSGLQARPGQRAELRYGGAVVGRFAADLVVESRVVVAARAGSAGRLHGRRHLHGCLRATGLATGVLLSFDARPSHVVVLARAHALPASRAHVAERALGGDQLPAGAERVTTPQAMRAPEFPEGSVR